MKKIGMALCLLCVMVMVVNVNCAAIFDGTSGTRGKNIQWGYVVLDVLFTGLVGIVIDFASGAIYAREGGSSEIEQQLKNYAMKGKPAYIVRNDGCYKVELVGTELKENKVPQNQIPANVWQAIENEKQKAALQLAK